MGIRFACHECGKRLNIKHELAGRRGVCPACAAKIRIPMSDAETSTAIEPKPQPVSAATVESFGTASSVPVTACAGGAETVQARDGEATWYVRPPSGGQYGPASTELLHQWIKEGRVAESSLLWRDGWPQWRAASETLPEFVGRLPSGLVSEPEPGPALMAEPAGVIRQEPEVSGRSNVGTTRRNRPSRRVLVIGVLSAVALMLVGVLVVVANFG